MPKFTAHFTVFTTENAHFHFALTTFLTQNAYISALLAALYEISVYEMSIYEMSVYEVSDYPLRFENFRSCSISLGDERRTTRFSISYKFVILLLISKENRPFSPFFGNFFSNPYKINNFGYFNFILVLCDCKFHRLYMNKFSKHLIQTCVSKKSQSGGGLTIKMC